jgi:MSHA pilin protein MshA
MESAIELVFSKSVIKGNQGRTTASGVNVVINGAVLDIKYGYPLANYSSANGSWEYLIELGDEAYSSIILGGHFVIYLDDVAPTTLNDKCMVSYQQVDGSTSSPNIKFNAC